MIKLSIKDITKSFGTTTVLHKLSLDIEEGESVVLLGPSGCGKTTLLKLIAGFLNPDFGTIEMDGQILSSSSSVVPPDKRKMSMVFQSYAIWPHRTVFQNVAYGLEVQRMSQDQIKKRVAGALDMVQLGAFADRYSTELSGGQQQRVALARAIVVEPSVLLLDEPLSNLDANLRIDMRTELADLQKKLGITFLYVTHDQSEAMVLGDRIVLLNDGYTIQIGSPPELYKRPLTQFSATFVGGANILTGNLQNPVSSDKLRIKTDFGVFDISAVEGVAKTAGEKVLFCIRPEWVVIDSANADSTKLNQFRGKIMSRQYYGKYIHYLVETAGGKISIETPDNLDFGSGSDVNVYFPPEKCVQVLQ